MRMAFLPSCLSLSSFSCDYLEGRRLFSSFPCVEALPRERVRVGVRALAESIEYIDRVHSTQKVLVHTVYSYTLVHSILQSCVVPLQKVVYAML